MLSREDLDKIAAAEEKRLGVGSKEFIQRHNEIMELIDGTIGTDKAIAALEEVGCSRARQYYNDWVAEYKTMRDAESKEVVHWYAAECEREWKKRQEEGEERRKQEMNRSVKFETMLCLVEDEQGGGKSTIARLLACKDEWFTDDIKNLDDENVYRKLQGHWIIEFSEMLATANTKTVEAIKAFLSRQKDTYKVPYDKYPNDFPRQYIFIGTTNNLDFLPNDKTGNRRFIPVLTNMKAAEVHPLENEAETRAFIEQAWAEAMEIYRNGEYTLVFPKELKSVLSEMQQSFTQEDPKVGIIQNWLDNCKYDSVCSIMIYREALGTGKG